MTSAAPAHALLSAAHSLLRAAMHHGRDQPRQPPTHTKDTSTDTLTVSKDPCIQNILLTDQNSLDILSTDPNVLPIDEITLPSEDVADLRDVVDAINKLCDTMKTSSYEVEEEEVPEYQWTQVGPGYATSIRTELSEAWTEETVACSATNNDMYNISEEWSESQEIIHEQVEVEDAWVTQNWTNEIPEASHSIPENEVCAEEYGQETHDVILPGLVEDVDQVASDGEPALQWDAPCSEMYYTASSEVSLVSDLDMPDRASNEMEDSLFTSDVADVNLLAGDLEVKEKEECVVAGHVAAMRERFESMTRSTTPCPEYGGATPASRNMSPLPDRS